MTLHTATLTRKPTASSQPQRILSIIFWIIALCLTLGLLSPAQAQTKTHVYNIESQPLSSALLAYSEASGIQILSPGGELINQTAPALSGSFTSSEALSRLLAGTGLTYQKTDMRTITIIPRGEDEVLKIDPITLIGQSAPVMQIEETTITGELQEATFYENVRPSIVRTNIPLSDIPRTIQTFNSDIIQSLRPISIQNIATLASNTDYGGDIEGTQQTFFVRGFEAPVLIDGFSLTGAANVMSPEVYGLERVEVLKGPDSIQFGQGEPGGLINLVTKRPLFEPKRDIELEFGSFGSAELRFDLGGTVANTDSLGFRLVSVIGEGEPWRDFEVNEQQLYIAPSMQWLLTDQTSLTVLAELNLLEGPADFGSVVGSDGELILPREAVITHPDNVFNRQQFKIGYDIDHTINASWEIAHRLRYFDNRYEYEPTLLQISFDETSGFLSKIPVRRESNQDTIIAQFTANGDFEIGSVRTLLSVGFDYSDNENLLLTGVDFAGFNAVNIFDLTFPALPSEDSLPYPPTDKNSEERIGAFIQAHAYLSDSIILSGGLRYDDTSVGGFTDAESQATTPQIGGVWKPINDVDIYANYSESFNPNSFSVDADGNVLDPEEGQGYELGIRWRPIPDRLAVSLGVFSVTKDNIAREDPDFPPFSGISISSGEETSEGIEIDIIGSITENWDIIASIGFSDTEIKDTGTEKFNVPAWGADIWTTYTFTNGLLEGFGIGGGFNHRAERWLDEANTIEFDPYTILNASLFYKRDNWAIDLALKNLTDEEYVFAGGGFPFRAIEIGRPFEAQLTLGYSF